MISFEKAVRCGVCLLIGTICALSGVAHAEDSNGKALFLRNCAACHQADGRGVPDVFPALAGNTFVQGNEHDAVSVLLTGRNGMPNFSKRLTDQDIALIVSYVRNAWGNSASGIEAGQVAALRSELHAETFDPTQQNIRH